MTGQYVIECQRTVDGTVMGIWFPIWHSKTHGKGAKDAAEYLKSLTEQEMSSQEVYPEGKKPHGHVTREYRLRYEIGK